MKATTTIAIAACLLCLASCTKEELVVPRRANTPDIKPDCVLPFAPVHQVTNNDPGLPDPAAIGLGNAPAGNGHLDPRSEHRWPPSIPEVQY